MEFWFKVKNNKEFSLVLILSKGKKVDENRGKRLPLAKYVVVYVYSKGCMSV